jgi:molybdenum cofactor biosynthesis enzyme MoaA
MDITEPPIDTFGRIHTNLRISVTDRCNIRCFYCIPETVRFLLRAEILTYEEIERFVRVVAQMGINKLRVTGDEPLVRAELPRLIEMLAAVAGIRDIPLTTNGILLAEQVLSGTEIREILEAEFGSLIPLARDDPSQLAVDYQFADSSGRMGFINPVTQPFGGNCNRLPITAEGKIRNCLFSTKEWDVRKLLRGGDRDDQIAETVRRAVHAKKSGHGIDTDEFIKPERAMHQIGGQW